MKKIIVFTLILFTIFGLVACKEPAVDSWSRDKWADFFYAQKHINSDTNDSILLVTRGIDNSELWIYCFPPKADGSPSDEFEMNNGNIIYVGKLTRIGWDKTNIETGKLNETGGKIFEEQYVYHFKAEKIMNCDDFTELTNHSYNLKAYDGYFCIKKTNDPEVFEITMPYNYTPISVLCGFKDFERVH